MNTDTNPIRRRIVTPTSDQYNTDPLLRHAFTYEEEKPPYLKYITTKNKINAYWGPVFFAFWILLYYCIAIPAFHHLPKPINIKDEPKNPDRFIAERAEVNLRRLVDIGPRVVGSKANEQITVNFFLDTIRKIKQDAHQDVDIEVDVQVASGSYIHWEMVNMYQGVQNVVVKVGQKDSNSTSYLLINSHFDSVPGGPGAGDDGTMVAVMLEVLRVISKATPLKSPILFLFNGAEENPLQASHAFITQHKWAKYVKALINLDSAGSGGRELLFQSGPNHPWLMRLYRKSAMHPFASTVAEEMFQRHFIPSDTDFRIFRDHGRVPGLDMAHNYNGYVYHTPFDRPEIIPRGTFQHTGDNVLGLARAIANSSELQDPSQYAEGHTVFYDILGYFLIFYSETEGIILNIIVCIIALSSIGASYFLMSQDTGITVDRIIKRGSILFGVHVFGCIAGIALTFLLGVFMDLLHMPMSWFTNSWLILGLYFCPLFFGMGIVPAVFIAKTKDDRLPVSFRVHLLLHGHCIFLVLLTLIMTICGIRSAFMLMLTILFYSMGLIINLITKLHNQPLLWMLPHVLCQIFPFLFYAYLSHGFFVAFIPMCGRFGAKTNPELIICAFTVGVGILCGAFMMPVLNLFKKSKTLISSLLVITVFFIILAATPIGFPYRPETSVQRFSILHTRRVFHEADLSVRRMETGYFIFPNDRRTYSVKQQALNMTKARTLTPDCESEVFCGLPVYNHRWHKARSSSLWIPGPDPVFDKLPELTIVSKNQISKTKIRYEMKLSGPDHMSIFINPLHGAKVKNWSFHQTPLRLDWQAPYFIYFSYGIDRKPLNFFVELERTTGDWSLENIEIGISGHWNHDEAMKTPEFKTFLASFPKYVDAAAWPSSYESWKY
ncbi:endoplasmic reticulum metallopeptidase 1-like isoform X1 [Eupeodes corollae]|uniref:endoplasmic reticulum metallopeptidase 1-like isoform X1 n=1 Tax=Eupeodes corollae TaxID=290404 RepID=UPI00248FAA32|nr:endoplasmic reticulum metallopeptidase 1-like isoform X1 [Eupeodes corollae]